MKNLTALVCMTGVVCMMGYVVILSAIRFFIHTSKKREKVTINS